MADDVTRGEGGAHCTKLYISQLVKELGLILKNSFIA
jgi:hypothetical protein